MGQNIDDASITMGIIMPFLSLGCCKVLIHCGRDSLTLNWSKGLDNDNILFYQNKFWFGIYSEISGMVSF